MTNPFMIYVDRDDPVPAHNTEELDTILDRIATTPRFQEFPVVAEIVSPDDQNVLQILLGHPDASFLIWNIDNETIEASVGTRPATGVVAFNYGGSRTDAYDDTLIDINAARDAAREFLGTGRRPTSIGWKTPQYS
jgi:hypothetical protein